MGNTPGVSRVGERMRDIFTVRVRLSRLGKVMDVWTATSLVMCLT
jgi:hypothetical protein